MKKKNDFVRVISSIVLGGFIAILLFAPNVRALSIPSGETMTINNDIGLQMLEIYGTAILEGDAAALLIYAFPGKELYEPGSTVHIYGCAPDNWFTVLEPSSQWQGQDAVVNIYGHRFQIDSNPSFDPPADIPLPDNLLYVLNELDEVQFSIRISSKVPIHLRPPESSKKPERVEAALNISPSTMNNNRMSPVISAMILLPEGITKDDVDDNYPLMIYSGENGAGVEAIHQRIFNSYSCEQDDSRVKIFALFNIGTLLNDLPEDCEQMQLQVCGILKTEQEFYCNDNIKIVKPYRKHWSYMKNWKNRK